LESCDRSFHFAGNRNIGKAREQGLPIGSFRPDHFKEGAALLTAAGAGGLLKGAPHPNAARLAFNWLLSCQGQIAFNKITPGRPERQISFG
jgi:ABC-type Fe3+ transport system substrate-binding protein